MTGLTYAQSGVDIDAGDNLVERIKGHARSTYSGQVLHGVGGFAGLFALPAMKEPVLVSGTDGVGTKLAIAIESGRHDTIGQDLVAMCVNDILTVGAKPLFFLDYYATGKLDVEVGVQVVASIASACRMAGCALLGGETAELPGFYRPGDYDLAGFVVGAVEKANILTGHDICVGDVVLGLHSSGLHSNGYSLARKVLLEHAGRTLDDAFGDGTLADELLRPTRIYTEVVAEALAAGGVKAMAHITGGGLPLNLPRVLPTGLGARLSECWPRPAIFDEIRRLGNVAGEEMRRTFNMGIGYVLVVDHARAGIVEKVLLERQEPFTRIGEIVLGSGVEYT